RANITIDELGFECSETLNYGNRVNVGAELIWARYNLFQDYGIKTHFTTNIINANDIERLYGEINRGRLREMCNWIYFNAGDQHVDRRK
ncbi:MAG: ATPase, partial [Flavobacteriales bacterium]|nr:ATPase [Flavobacteriales bacterium]